MFKIKNILFVGLLLCATACEDLLDVEPRQSIDSAVALNTQEGINAAITSTYVNFKNVALYGRDLLAIAECLGDDARVINRAGGRFVNESNNLINNHLGGWAIYYEGINQINLVLEALPTSSFSDARKDQLVGEVKFLRALYYFNLSRIYGYDPKAIVANLDKGSVPLLLTGVSSNGQVAYPKRNTTAEIYAQLYKDLEEAVAKAPATGGPNRATKGAAMALFARVALYNEDWDNAIKYATQAIDAKVGRFVGNTELVASWRSQSHPESIFEILFSANRESLGVNDAVQSAYSTIASVAQANALAAVRPTPLPPPTGQGGVVPTAAFLALHQTGDVRRLLYQDGLNRSNVVAIECTKFLGKSGVVYMDNIPVIRVSEMYLIRAEANARSNKDLTAALADVNLIRTRAGLPEAKDLTPEALVAEIALQRRLELAFEGHRWFDLKRQSRDIVKTTGNVPYGDARILAPIPNAEIIANKNLVQNFGY